MLTYNVRVCNHAQTTSFDSELDNLQINDYVIVETQTGSEWGVIANTGIPKKAHARPNAQILRKADKKDQRQINMLLKSADFAIGKATEQVGKLHLEMKILSAHYTFICIWK